MDSTDIERKLSELKDRSAALFRTAPDSLRAFGSLKAAASKDGALDTRIKELMTLAIAIVTRCEGCILLHTKEAIRHHASREELAETIAVAIEMGGGPAVVYGASALAVYDELKKTSGNIEQNHCSS